ncbi:hypothetical protein ACH41E_33365 [Streptomyces sp. NPDC020412]|uniref:hypothetical protein n=1 Tax=Streptomyces sp. NPDC020412 TaxID=3365073 RepID=UPI00378E1043
MKMFGRLLEAEAEFGNYRFVISVEGIGGTILHPFLLQREGKVLHVDEDQANEFAHLLAVLVSGAHSGALVMRLEAGGEQSVRGWRFREGDAKPLNRAEVFDAYCYTPSGEIHPPEPGVEYKDAPVIHL